MPSLAAFRWSEIQLRTALGDTRRIAGWWLLALLTCVTIVLLSRRLSGALVVPLPPGALLLIGVGLAVLARAYRLLLEQSAAIVDGIVPLLALALTVPGSSLWGVVLLWLVPVGEAISARRFLKHAPLSSDFNKRIEGNVEKVSVQSGFFAVDDEAAEESPREYPTQKLTYAQDETGAMTVRGWLRVPLLAGQRIALAHTAFCPAFAVVPQAEAEPTAGPNCVIRPSQVLPWGIRWEIKLSATATSDEQVEFEFFAACGELA